MDEVAVRIFEALSLTGMEQKEFAGLVGVSDKTVNNWKKGRSLSFKSKLSQIAAALGVTREYLEFGTTLEADGLTAHEKQLIEAYRKADSRTRQIVDLNLEPFGLSLAQEKAT